MALSSIFVTFVAKTASFFAVGLAEFVSEDYF
jgi:hypothetical protein